KMLDGNDGGFSNQFIKKVGNGLNTSFWLDKWVGDVPLNVRFPRLFHLEGNKDIMAGCKGRWVEGVWEWVWDWVRPPRGRAVEDLDNLNELLGDVSFSQDRVDR
ncbi:hypothetical protein Tco_0233325, partial [Tanacetum coccineum]